MSVARILRPQGLDEPLRSSEESVNVQAVGVGDHLLGDPRDQPHQRGRQRLAYPEDPLEHRQAQSSTSPPYFHKEDSLSSVASSSDQTALSWHFSAYAYHIPGAHLRLFCRFMLRELLLRGFCMRYRSGTNVGQCMREAELEDGGYRCRLPHLPRS